MTTVVGVDPGRVTGMCAFEDGRFVEGAETRSYDGVVKFILDFRADVVVIEDFRVRRGQPSDYHPSIRTIGVVEYVCQCNGIPLIIQSPSILRFTLEAQKGLHRSRHVKSAAAHVSYYLKKAAKNAPSR